MRGSIDPFAPAAAAAVAAIYIHFSSRDGLVFFSSFLPSSLRFACTHRVPLCPHTVGLEDTSATEENRWMVRANMVLVAAAFACLPGRAKGGLA